MMWRKLAPTAILFGFSLFLLAGPLEPFIGYYVIPLPMSRDPELVGRWAGESFARSPVPSKHVETEFRANGKGIFWRNGQRCGAFEWGTDGNVLYTREMRTDAWIGYQRKYRLDPVGVAHFSRARSYGVVATEMRRDSRLTRPSP